MKITGFAHLTSLDVRKSTGPDNLLSSWFLKEVAGEIADPFTNLFNYSLQQKVAPSAWKRSHNHLFIRVVLPQRTLLTIVQLLLSL